jgi:hypothetical protein
MQPSLPLSSMVKPFDIEKMSSKDVLKKEQEIMPLQRQADQNLAAVNAKVEQDVLTAKAESTSNYAKDINEKLEEKKKKEAEFPYPEFHPTQDNVKSLGELFSVMSVVGLMLGGSGKLSAMNALGSMSGMMKGWQEGRADLFKREKETFDKEFAKVKQFHSDLQQAFDEYMKLAPVNREAAMYAKEQFIRQAGSSSILAAQMDKGNLDGVAKLLASAKATIQHGEDKLLDQQRFALEQRKATETERHDRETEEAARLRAATGKGGAQATALRVLSQDIGNAKYNLEDLKKLSEKTGKLPGGSFAFANYFKGDLSSDIIRYATSQLVESNLRAGDALMLNLAFDIASGQGGGRGQLSDSKIRNVVSQFPLDSDPESVKATKWGAIFNRVEEINKSLPSEQQIILPPELKDYYTKSSSKSGGLSKSEASRLAELQAKRDRGEL